MAWVLIAYGHLIPLKKRNPFQRLHVSFCVPLPPRPFLADDGLTCTKYVEQVWQVCIADTQRHANVL